MAGKAMILRRARGYAPFPIKVNDGDFPPILAVGSYFKNTVAIYQKNQVFISQHIGDLDTVNAVTAADIQRVAKETFTPENRTIGRILPK